MSFPFVFCAACRRVRASLFRAIIGFERGAMDRQKVMTTIARFFLLALIALPCGAADDPSVAAQSKQAAKTVENAAQQVGEDAKAAGNKVADQAKTVAKDVADSARKTTQDIADAAKKTAM
jgi:hypothetical protein